MEWSDFYTTILAVILIFVSVGQVRTESATEGKPHLPQPTDYPVGDPRRCYKAGTGELRLEVIPGGGWDNLGNKDAGNVMKHNYSKCLTTDDGRYLIPDGVVTIPKKSSNVDTYAELIMHWNNYTSTLSNSINVHAGLSLKNIDISGKFSDEYEKVKTRQYTDKSVTTRVQVRYVRYTARTQPDFDIDETLRARLRKIAADIEMNRTALATYESQLVVRDFGTHVTTSVDIGAAMVQVDHLHSTFVRTEEAEKNTILASASASFFGIFDFGIDTSHTTKTDLFKQYLKQRTTSHIATYGGPVFRPTNYTSLNWSSSLENDMVALDRSGDPIYYVVSSASLPDLPQSTVYKVYDHIKEAVEIYYKHNTYRGCTDPEAPNFSFMANENDGSCKPPSTNYTFGGVYQTCRGSGYTNLCKDNGLIQNNPLTGRPSCPDEYEAVHLQDGHAQSSTRRHECHRCWLFFHCCKDKTYYASASYSAYWCAAKGHVDQNHGFLFGGLYTKMSGNPLTETLSCPSQFYGLKLLRDLTICVSDDYELGFGLSLPFAGFFSCNSGNPLALKKSSKVHSAATGNQHTLMSYMLSQGAASWPKECPSGFSQHLAVVDNGCEINYCVQSGALSPKGLPKVKRPPFMEFPHDMYLLEEPEFVFNDDGSVWTSMAEAQTLYADITTGSVNGDQKRMVPSKYASLSPGAAAGIGIAATLAAVLMVIAAIAAYRRRQGRLYKETDPWDRRPITSDRNFHQSGSYGGYNQEQTSTTNA